MFKNHKKPLEKCVFGLPRGAGELVLGDLRGSLGGLGGVLAGAGVVLGGLGGVGKEPRTARSD